MSVPASVYTEFFTLNLSQGLVWPSLTTKNPSGRPALQSSSESVKVIKTDHSFELWAFQRACIHSFLRRIIFSRREISETTINIKHKEFRNPNESKQTKHRIYRDPLFSVESHYFPLSSSSSSSSFRERQALSGACREPPLRCTNLPIFVVYFPICSYFL